MGAGCLIGSICKIVKAGLASGVEETLARGIEGTVIAMNGVGGTDAVEALAKKVTEKVVGKGDDIKGISKGIDVDSDLVDDTVQHAVGSANQAQSVLDGIDPQYFNKKSRFIGGFYVGADSDTIVAELAEHGNIAKYAISYDVNLSGQKVLDLTNPDVASEWGFVQNLTSTKACQKIGDLAKIQGYSAIKFQSYRGSGIKYVLYNNFEDILTPTIVTLID